MALSVFLNARGLDNQVKMLVEGYEPVRKKGCRGGGEPAPVMMFIKAVAESSQSIRHRPMQGGQPSERPRFLLKE